MTTGRTIERLVIEVGHKVDGAALDKARAEARAAAEEIRREFDVTAEQVKRAADDIAKENEDAAEKTSEVWTGALRRVGEKLTDFAAGLPGKIASFVKDTFEGVREVDTFAQSIGVGTVELIALEKGFERVRVPADNTREAVKTLTENLGEMRRLGSGPAVDSLGSLGLKLADLDGLNTEQTLKVLADRLVGIEDESKRTSIAIELMGEDGRALLPALLDGASGVETLTQAAREAGQVIDQETIEASRELDAKLAEVKGTAEGVALSLLESLAPAAVDVADKTLAWTEKNQELIDQNLPTLVDQITTAMTLLAEGVLKAAGALSSLRDGFADLRKTTDDTAVGRWILGLQGIELDSAGRRVEAGSQRRANTSAAESNRALAAGEYVPVNASRRDENGDFAEADGVTLGARGPSNATISEAERARLNAQRRIEQHNARVRREKFEAEAKEGTGSRGGKRGESAAIKQARQDAEFTGLADELRKLGDRYAATPKAVEKAIDSVVKAYAGGASQSVARKRGLGTLGGLVGVDLNKQISRDPLSQLLGIDALPDASPAEMAQERAPQVLTATINNSYAINNQFAINGSDRPDLVPDQVIDRMREVFEHEVNKSGNYSKVVLAR